MEGDNDLLYCEMVTGGKKQLKKLTIRLNNGQIDQFVQKAGSLENAICILEKNHCAKNAELLLRKQVQAYPIYYSFMREYCKVKNLEKHIEYLATIKSKIK
jgi:hypothetical protein